MRYLVFFLFGILGIGKGYAGDYVKYVRQMYAVEAGTNCLMDFRFGQVVLKWEKEDLAEHLGFRLDAWSDIWKLYLEIASGFNREADLKAEINVWVPQRITLELLNRFGNVRLPEYHAQLPLSLTAVYGNIQADSVSSLPDAELFFNVSYGKLEIRNCEKANVRSAYSSVGVKSARYLQIKAEKSYIALWNIDTIISQGEFNKYDIH